MKVIKPRIFYNLVHIPEIEIKHLDPIVNEIKTTSRYEIIEENFRLDEDGEETNIADAVLEYENFIEREYSNTAFEIDIVAPPYWIELISNSYIEILMQNSEDDSEYLDVLKNGKLMAFKIFAPYQTNYDGEDIITSHMCVKVKEINIWCES